MEIFENKSLGNLANAWLDHDHYKWRAMRAAGVPEELITGHIRKDGSVKRFKVVYTLIATSKYSTIDIIPTKSLSTEENEMTGYIWLSKNSFNNIVKIDG